VPIGGKFPIGWSLGIIVGILVISITASLLIPHRNSTLPSAREASRPEVRVHSNLGGRYRLSCWGAVA